MNKDLKKLYINEDVFDFLDSSITEFEKINEELQKINKEVNPDNSDLSLPKLDVVSKKINEMSKIFAELAKSIFSNPLLDLPENELLESQKDNKDELSDSELINKQMENELDRLEKRLERLNNYIEFSEGKSNYKKLKDTKNKLTNKLKSLLKEY